MKTKLRVLTNSEQKVRRRCAREHHYAYNLGYRSVDPEADALRFGTLIHKSLEQWWLAPHDMRLTYALAALPLDIDPYELARATEMLRGYDLRWRNEPLEVLTVWGEGALGRPLVEAEFRAPLVSPITSQVSPHFELGGKLDVLALNLRDARPYIIEHKTTSEDISIGSVYWQALRIDSQISTYYVGARALNYEAAGVVYDVLAKPQLKPLAATPEDKRRVRKDGQLYANVREHDETPAEYQQRVSDDIADNPDKYFRRGTVVRLADEEVEAAWDTWQTSVQIRHDELAGRWARNPDACKRWSGMCPFFGVCTRTESLEDTRLFRKLEHVHEELSAAPLAQPPTLAH